MKVQNALPQGLFRVGKKLYAVCENCNQVVRVDKPIIGGLHFCDKAAR